MSTRVRTPSGEAATQIILGTFRANSLLLAAGDLLGAADGLTSARWQVLGAIALPEAGGLGQRTGGGARPLGSRDGRARTR